MRSDEEDPPFWTEEAMPLRGRVAALVASYDAEGDAEGSFPVKALEDTARCSFNEVIIEEVFPAPSSVDAIRDALLRGLGEYPLPFAAACTASKGQESKLGKTFGVYFHKSGVTVIDTHNRCGPISRIPDQGGCVATLGSHDAHVLANWLAVVHLPSIDCCSDALEIIFVAHSGNKFWREKVEDAVSKDEVLQKMLALKPCMRKSLPGDYLAWGFYGQPILQLCACGMKLATLQASLQETAASYGGSSLADDTASIVQWLLKAWCSQPRSLSANVKQRVASKCKTHGRTSPPPFRKMLNLRLSRQ